MLIGYVRVSTGEQNTDLQEDALKKAECDKIFKDTASGAKTDRPGLEEALAFLREGDTLVVWKLDRLGRSLKHLIEVVNELYDRGIYFKSLQENIDTNSSGGKLIFHILVHSQNSSGISSEREQGPALKQPVPVAE